MLLKASLAQYFLQKCYMCFSTEDFVAQTPTWALPPDPTGVLSSPRLHILDPKPAYAPGTMSSFKAVLLTY